MKAIKPGIRLIENKNSTKYHVATQKDGEPYRKTFDTLEEAEAVLKDIQLHTRNKNHEYPLDFIDALFGDDKTLDIGYVETHFDENIKEVIKSLTEREQKVIQLRFIDGYTLEAVARQFSVTRERIRQIEQKALRKLRHPSRLEYLRKGREVKQLQDDILNLQTQLVIQKEIMLKKLANPELIDVTNEEIIGAKTIESLDFSVRTYNCLKRGGITKLHEIYELDVIDLLRIRNLGKKSAREIMSKLKEIGLEMKGSEHIK